MELNKVDYSLKHLFMKPFRNEWLGGILETFQ